MLVGNNEHVSFYASERINTRLTVEKITAERMSD